MTTAQTANTLTDETYRKGEVVAVHAMKAYGRVEEKLHSFLNLGNDGVNGQLQAPAVLPPGKMPPLVIVHEDCRMGTRTGPDAPYKKNLLLMPGPAPSPPSTNYYT
jgi:hypothetical protein